MKIESYLVQASASRSYIGIESSSIMVSNSREPIQREEVAEPKDKVEISDTMKEWLERFEQDKNKFTQQLKLPDLKTRGLDSLLPVNVEDLKIKLLESILAALTGKKISVSPAGTAKGRGKGGSHHGNGSNLGQIQGGGTRQGATVQTTTFKAQHFQYESESVSYQAKGVVKTADGKSINIDIALNMSREFVSHSEFSMSIQNNPKDPLIIHYGGTAASLTNEKFEFDLDFDGAMDSISFAGEGSGFLAYDKNGDGKINDGSELFGPSSGSGFGELRSHDVDGNGWIDENDDIFDKLLVWSKDKDGKDQLFKLKDLDIGAIYLGDVETQYSMNDSQNNTHGLMRSTSFFLRESGTAGTIHHVDLMY